MLFWRWLIQENKKDGVYFQQLVLLLWLPSTLTLSNKTEAGSNGVKPAKDCHYD